MTLAFDILLVSALLWLAWRALAAADLFKGVVLFMAFGLLLALAWVRLRAPDVALAEAAIGSGLTGALFLSALGCLQRADPKDETASPATAGARPGSRIWRVLATASVVAATVGLGWAVQRIPKGAPNLSAAVQEQLGTSGVSNPVTAVLLNFRSYDTLLEIGVLLLAIIAVSALGRADQIADLPQNSVSSGRLSSGTLRGTPWVSSQQTALVNLLVPLMVVVAGYLLWKGATAPGGAFQAGAVLGGAGVLLNLSRPAWVARCHPAWLRAGLAAGLCVFLGVGVALAISGRRLLEYPPDWAGALILVIETAATLSIGLTLALLFLGGSQAEPTHARGHRSAQARDTNS